MKANKVVNMNQSKQQKTVQVAQTPNYKKMIAALRSQRAELPRVMDSKAAETLLDGLSERKKKNGRDVRERNVIEYKDPIDEGQIWKLKKAVEIRRRYYCSILDIVEGTSQETRRGTSTRWGGEYMWIPGLNYHVMTFPWGKSDRVLDIPFLWLTYEERTWLSKMKPFMNYDEEQWWVGEDHEMLMEWAQYSSGEDVWDDEALMFW